MTFKLQLDFDDIARAITLFVADQLDVEGDNVYVENFSDGDGNVGWEAKVEIAFPHE